MDIPVFRPNLRTDEILAALRPVLDSGWIGLGPRTAELEARLAARVGCRHGIGMASATAALHLALAVLDVQPGDEVLVPAITFASTGLAALYCGARPVFVDVRPDTLCLDPEDAAAKVTPRTRGIVPVHFAGHPCAMDELEALARDRGLWLVEDCAHALVGTWRGRPLGSFGVMGCFSFHAVKALPTGDGGMITTQDERLDQRLRRLRWLGIDRDTWKRAGGGRYSWRYRIDELGWKAHLNDVVAAIGLVQLGYVDQDNLARRRLAQRYGELLAPIAAIRCPVELPGAESAWHAYVVRVQGDGARDRLHEGLAALGISTGVHYEPLHHHAVFAQTDLRLPVADGLWEELLTLPLYPTLSDEDQERVVAGIRQVLG